MRKKLKIEFPSQGWKQFLTARKQMLDGFDRAREQAKAHEVETFHGKVAEAEFRQWLSDFLPKKYGVTSGYVVSPGLKSTQKTPHFDVIIYDLLDSPVLWVEDMPDASAQGRSLAIPVEYVRAVLEVKSEFSPKTVIEAIEHLRDLEPVMAGPDPRDETYKLHLPATFCCAVVFFELRSKHEFSKTALTNLVSGVGLRQFFGGLILRGEGHSDPLSGKIIIISGEERTKSTIGKGKTSLLSEGLIGESVQLGEKMFLTPTLTWLQSAFSMFAFDLIAIMDGKYRPGSVSSFYGLGGSNVETAWSL